MPREHADPATAGLYDAGGDHARPCPAEARGAGLRTLAGLLRAAGLDPSPEEIADALWLAARTREAARTATPDAGEGPEPEPARRKPARPQGSPGRAGGTGPPADAEEPPPARVREDDPAEDPVRLYPAGALAAADPAPDTEVPVAGGVPVRVPGAAALPRILDIQRALRALQRRRPPGPPTRTVLDEPATAEASARALGLVLPVFRPESRREATVRLVMDASPSMAVWQDMFDELRAVCERLGAFRDVQVHYLHRLPDGTAAVGRGPAPAAGVRSGDQLRDPTGRALTMVVSDCAGPVWREGEAQRLLHRWAGCAPCVVVQPLPQRLWNRSWLPTERGVLERAPAGAGATPGGTGGGPGLRFRPDRPARPGRPTGGLTVPVLPPSATALGAWARLVAGLGSGPVPAEVGRVLARHPAAPVPPPRTARPPRELVRRFRSSAAPGAVQLAVYLSAAPLTLPVMRLVQRTMLPDSEPSDLAEVLLSGLLRRSGASPGPWYEFVPGVQDVLLGPLGRDEAALVLKHCSEYVLAHFGRGVRNFPALAVSQLTGVPEGVADVPDAEQAPAGPLPQAFAQVSAKVVRRYLPGPPEEDPAPAPAPAPPGRAASVRAARGRLLLAEADGDARHLHDAAALLRRAAALPPGPEDPPEEAETELAGVLLRLWAVQRDPELLDEAERAVTGLRTAGGWAVLGRVLYERGLASGPDGDALLAAAAREFAAAGAAAGAAAAQDAELRVDCAVRRARTLIRLSELRAEPGPLYEALAALEPLATDPRTTHPDVLLALGATLLALLARTPSPPDRTALAERAAEALERALALLEAAPAGPSRPSTAAPAPAGPTAGRDRGAADPAPLPPGGQEDPAGRGPGPTPEADPGPRPGAEAPGGGGSTEAAGTDGTAGTAGEDAEPADGPGSGASVRAGAAAPDGPRHGGTEGSAGDGRTGAGRLGSPDDGGAAAPEKAGRSGGDGSAASDGDGPGASAPTGRTNRPGAALPHRADDTPTTGDTTQMPARDGGATGRPDSPRVEAPDLDEAAPATGDAAQVPARDGGVAGRPDSPRVEAPDVDEAAPATGDAAPPGAGRRDGSGAGANRGDGPGGPAGEPASAGAGPGGGARGGASGRVADGASTGTGAAKADGSGAGADRGDEPGGPAGEPASAGVGPGGRGRGGASGRVADGASTGTGGAEADGSGAGADGGDGPGGPVGGPASAGAGPGGGARGGASGRAADGASTGTRVGADRGDGPGGPAGEPASAGDGPNGGRDGGPVSAGASPGDGARGGASGPDTEPVSTGAGASDRGRAGAQAGERAPVGARRGYGTGGGASGRDTDPASPGGATAGGARGGPSDAGTDPASPGAGDGGGVAPRAEGARAGEPDRGGTADGEGAGGADGRADGPRIGAPERTGDTPAARAASAPGAASAPRADAADRGGAGASAGESAPSGAGEAGRPGEARRALEAGRAGEAGWAGGGARGRDGGRGRRIAWVRVELAGALRYLPGRLEEARVQLLRALEEGVGEPELRLAALLCLARVHRARYDRDGEPVALEEAAEAYARARRLIPRDGDAYAGLLPEWGDVLLERARAADGRRFSSTAVRVLRESRSAVAQSDPGAPYRLVRLASGLRLRHAYEGDLVDLREAEYLLELAVRQSHRPLERARAWRDHGDVQQEIHAHTRTADRLDRAADSYRRAWRAALEAGRDDPGDTGAALRLAARVQELRGGALERLARPRAALDAYRAALELWQRQGLADGERAGAVRERIHALETGG
ncbi:SAV_2336 N-terminal domain-related protein [Streptomyces sp. NPDC096033]|uniref:SAV_2336 N-terminal domain-related protein n=1 Tax=Streptomyces sp. NPDC096033 TaxID=3366071 RepID=UPI00380D7217